MTKPLSNQQGSILLLVLVIVAVLSALSIELAFSTRVDLRLTETFRDSTQAYYLAKGGMEVGKAFIENDQLLNVDAFPVEDHFVSVHSLDLGGRIDLNRLLDSRGINPDPVFIDRLGRLLDSQGLGPAEIAQLTDALIDWIDVDSTPRPDGAEDSFYRGESPPRSAKNGPLDRLDELAQVRGFTKEILDALRPHVTVQGDAKVNLNSAAAEVLTALSEDIDTAAAESLIEFRQERALETAADLASVPGLSAAARSALSLHGQFKSSTFELKSTAEVGDGRRTILAVIQKGASGPLYMRIE